MGWRKVDDWIFRFLRWFCPDHLYEEIEGDLIQRFVRDVREFGERKAKSRLIWNTIRFFRAEIILRNTFSLPLLRMYMLSNYVKVAFRSFQKQGVFTALNVIGLSVGMAASLLILQYVKYERSFDAFHSRAEDIYRIQYNVWHNGRINFESAAAVPAVRSGLEEQFRRSRGIYAVISCRRGHDLREPGPRSNIFP